MTKIQFHEYAQVTFCTIIFFSQVAIESIENIRTVASLTVENAIRQKFEEALEGPYRSALLNAHVVGITFSLSQAVIFFAYGTSFWFGAYLIEQGEIDYVDVFK